MFLFCFDGLFYLFCFGFVVTILTVSAKNKLLDVVIVVVVFSFLVIRVLLMTGEFVGHTLIDTGRFKYHNGSSLI